ncbi:MAG: hypothetical protein KDD58_01575 [Bdellovibrionales bacterium]|nr:hypothetical protein [Bdellovibrionales bacterium]
MNEKNKKITQRFALFLLGLAILFWGVFGIKKRFEPKKNKSEWEILNDDSENINRRILALNNLSDNYSKKTFLIMKKWLNSLDDEKKVAALRVLVRINNDETTKELNNFFENKNLESLNFDETLVYYHFKYLTANSSQQKQDIIDNLFNLLEIHSNTENYQILNLIFVLDSENDKLIKKLISILDENKEEALMALSINKLSILKNKWLKNNIKNFVFSDKEHIRLISLNSLPRLCLSNSLEIVDKFIVEENNEKMLNFAKKIREKVVESPDCFVE